MKQTKRWSIRFTNAEGDVKYVNVIGANLLKVIEWVIKENGIEPEAIDYASSDDVIIIE